MKSAIPVPATAFLTSAELVQVADQTKPLWLLDAEIDGQEPVHLRVGLAEIEIDAGMGAECPTVEDTTPVPCESDAGGSADESAVEWLTQAAGCQLHWRLWCEPGSATTYLAVRSGAREGGPISVRARLIALALGMDDGGRCETLELRTKPVLAGLAGTRALLLTGPLRRFQPAFRLWVRTRCGTLDVTTEQRHVAVDPGDARAHGALPVVCADLALDVRGDESSGLVMGFDREASPYLDEAWRRYCHRRKQGHIGARHGLYTRGVTLP